MSQTACYGTISHVIYERDIFRFPTPPLSCLYITTRSYILCFNPQTLLQYEHLAQHRGMDYSYINDCKQPNTPVVVNIMSVVDVIDKYLLNNNWERIIYKDDKS